MLNFHETRDACAGLKRGLYIQDSPSWEGHQQYVAVPAQLERPPLPQPEATAPADRLAALKARLEAGRSRATAGTAETVRFVVAAGQLQALHLEFARVRPGQGQFSSRKWKLSLEVPLLSVTLWDVPPGSGGNSLLMQPNMAVQALRRILTDRQLTCASTTPAHSRFRCGSCRPQAPPLEATPVSSSVVPPRRLLCPPRWHTRCPLQYQYQPLSFPPC